MVKVFVELSGFAATATREQLRDRISLGESGGIASAPYDPIAFCRAVTPHLA